MESFTTSVKVSVLEIGLPSFWAGIMQGAGKRFAGALE
jgi:hypothetical protein